MEHIQKITVIVLLALLIGVVLFSQTPEGEPHLQSATPEENEMELPVRADSEQENIDTEAVQTEPGDTPVPLQTDVGMEFPTPDTTPNDATGVTEADKPESHVFAVSGKNFTFDITEIRVREGDTVTINFRSTGGLHDWVIDEFNAQTKRVEKGEETSVTFVADRAGVYEYYCSAGIHRSLGMVGSLIVE